jgi:hypothetical protein
LTVKTGVYFQLKLLHVPAGKEPVVKSYDVFRSDPDGPVWLESIPNLENAKARILALSLKFPHKSFFVFDTSRARIVAEQSGGKVSFRQAS